MVGVTTMTYWSGWAEWGRVLVPVAAAVWSAPSGPNGWCTTTLVTGTFVPVSWTSAARGGIP